MWDFVLGIVVTMIFGSAVLGAWLGSRSTSQSEVVERTMVREVRRRTRDRLERHIEDQQDRERLPLGRVVRAVRSHRARLNALDRQFARLIRLPLLIRTAHALPDILKRRRTIQQLLRRWRPMVKLAERIEFEIVATRESLDQLGEFGLEAKQRTEALRQKIEAARSSQLSVDQLRVLLFEHSGVGMGRGLAFLSREGERYLTRRQRQVKSVQLTRSLEGAYRIAEQSAALLVISGQIGLESLDRAAVSLMQVKELVQPLETLEALAEFTAELPIEISPSSLMLDEYLKAATEAMQISLRAAESLRDLTDEDELEKTLQEQVDQLKTRLAGFHEEGAAHLEATAEIDDELVDVDSSPEIESSDHKSANA